MAHNAGRFLQLLGLLSMPSAIWAAEFYRSEVLSVGLFVVSAVLFLIGYFLTTIRK